MKLHHFFRSSVSGRRRILLAGKGLPGTLAACQALPAFRQGCPPAAPDSQA